MESDEPVGAGGLIATVDAILGLYSVGTKPRYMYCTYSATWSTVAEAFYLLCVTEK